MPFRLDFDLAARFAATALANVVLEYPNKLDHVMAGPADVRTPRALHPAFYGSFDWHSCVHMHWLLARLRRLHPDLPQRDAIDALLERHFDTACIAGEVAYLSQRHTSSFERTYGWAWLLKLADELAHGDDDASRRWSAALAPLADAFVARYLAYLPKASYPIRYGMHANSAFGVTFALDYARRVGHAALAEACVDRASRWFADDRDVPAAWEPSGADFLSPSLIEAELMRRVLGPARFTSWLTDFLPGLEKGRPVSLFEPAVPTDRGDGQIVHLDGLNLSRAWCFGAIADALPSGDRRAPVLRDAAAAHLAAGMKGIESGNYMGEHWLATFAALALTGA